MPSTYAHRRFGTNVLEHLPDELRAQLEQNRELYDIGLHGPDLLFYYHAAKSNPVGALGNAMHEEPGRVFFDRARRVVHCEADRDAALAYALGFVCHFALDSTCHPYVEQFTRESGVTHCEIETEFDNMLLRRDGYDPLKFFTASHIHPSEQNAKAIAPFYEGISEQVALDSLKGMISVHRLLQASNPVKRWVVLTGMKVVGKYDMLHGTGAGDHRPFACLAGNADRGLPFGADLWSSKRKISVQPAYPGLHRGLHRHCGVCLLPDQPVAVLDTGRAGGHVPGRRAGTEPQPLCQDHPG